jgi:hypothetical protein
MLLDPSARYRDYLSASYVRQLVKALETGTVNSAHRLWSILTFESWLRSLPQWTQRPAEEPVYYERQL